MYRDVILQPLSQNISVQDYPELYKIVIWKNERTCSGNSHTGKPIICAWTLETHIALIKNLVWVKSNWWHCIIKSRHGLDQLKYCNWPNENNSRSFGQSRNDPKTLKRTLVLLCYVWYVPIQQPSGRTWIVLLPKLKGALGNLFISPVWVVITHSAILKYRLTTSEESPCGILIILPATDSAETVVFTMALGITFLVTTMLANKFTGADVSDLTKYS